METRNLVDPATVLYQGFTADTFGEGFGLGGGVGLAWLLPGQKPKVAVTGDPEVIGTGTFVETPTVQLSTFFVFDASVEPHYQWRFSDDDIALQIGAGAGGHVGVAIYDGELLSGEPPVLVVDWTVISRVRLGWRLGERLELSATYTTHVQPWLAHTVSLGFALLAK